MGEQDLILGIDLGTTFSAMAYVDRHGKPVILPNAEGHRTTASVIHFYEPNACIVGEEAIKAILADASNVVQFVKRHMGDTSFRLEFFGKSYAPQELSAIILRKLKDDAEERLGHEVRDAVITVPAYFNNSQRGATMEAGQLAGFNVLSIINEPTAAAIAYGIERLGSDRNVMVFDLGGGTFDVTVMQIRGTSLRTIATDGNAELGGKDWDDRLLSYVADQFVAQYGEDPRDDVQVYQEMYIRCLAAKIALSTKARVAIPVGYKGQRGIFQVTREQFEGVTKDLVQQCADTCEIVMERARMRWTDLDDILLAGGSTRMPMIQEMLRRLTNKELVQGVNPDECVALGASLAGVFRHRPQHPAIQLHRQSVAQRNRDAGGVAPVNRGTSNASRRLSTQPASPAPLTPTPGLPSVRITDVSSHPLGIVVLDASLQEHIVNVIPQFTELPCERHRRFAYAYDNITAVRVEVTEGTGSARDEVAVIGEVILDKLPPRPKGTPIEVIYRYSIDNILEVDVVDVETRKTARARLKIDGLLNPEERNAARRQVAVANIH